MKLFENVEVSGLTHVVFYHDTHWKRMNYKTDYVWLRLGEHKKVMSHEHMLDIIRRKIGDPRYRMWIHGESLNIERNFVKDEEVMSEIATCHTCGREIREGSTVMSGTRFYIFKGNLYHEKCLKDQPGAHFYNLGEIHL